ncbi:YopX family protein [Streptococcus pneumoniae]|uniref:YopX family protein n=1 Tax=Streptococcus pneumoniae TaxID=1313 RepID=UPI0005E7CEE4|nr:YopX family protein [Streptococcus pneumoniae]CTN91723.1 putative prophage protein [Streptococcus pneumoniae]
MIPKFRVWHHELGRLMSVKCMFFQDSEIEEFELNDTLMNDYITAYPDEIELMQSTGLRDKNGKEVFVGDIIKCTRGCLHEVYIEKEYGGTFIGGMPAIYLKGFLSGYAWTEHEEIIGNIYENLEFLEANE